MNDGDVFGFKIMVHACVEFMLDRAKTQEVERQQALRVIMAEILGLAAELHDGNDESFLLMARRSLSIARTGAIEQ
jgi:hypothetical protein